MEIGIQFNIDVSTIKRLLKNYVWFYVFNVVFDTRVIPSFSKVRVKLMKPKSSFQRNGVNIFLFFVYFVNVIEMKWQKYACVFM